MPIPADRPEAVVTALVDAGSSLTLGTNLFMGPPRPWRATGIPRDAVFVYSMLSFRPLVYVSPSKESLRDFRVNLFVRQNQDQFATGQALARDLWDILQMADVSVYTGYITCLMAESDPQYIGLSDTDDHRWIFTARLIFKG
jgi:hypothetical protein